MDFKQKAEEKKMSMSKNIARLAVTAGLTAALSFGGVMAPVTMAFADGAAAPDNSITIKKVAEDNKGNTFKAYQIFKAKVVDEKDNGKVASDIEWANDAISSKVIAAITGSTEYQALVEKDSTKKLKDGASASDVAEWLSQNVNRTHASSADSSDGTRVAPGDVLYEIAAAVSGMKQGVKAETAAGTLTADTPWTRPGTYGDGYYLFVSDGLTDTTKQNTGTSPIFAIVGGDPVTVTEKTSIPKVDKKILDDTVGKDVANAEEKDWKNYGDAWIGQKIDYRLTGTVADNIASYDKYQYVFQDHLSVGLKADENSIVVTINGKKIDKSGNYYTATVTDTTDDLNNKTGQDLKVSFDDLKAAANSVNVTLDGTSKVVVTYQATLTSDAKYTTAGNTNEVKLVYSNDPMSNGTGTSESKKVTDYVFGFDVTKTDPDNSSAQLVAGFTVKMTKEGSGKNVEKWLKQDGSFSNNKNDAYTFETTETGNKVFIPGLVAGTYLISESKTPAGYNTIADFEITVTPEYNTDGTLKKLSVAPGSDMVAVNIKDGATTTRIPVTIQNKKGSGLPLTGLNGVTFTWIAGGAVLCIGVAHLIRSRKQAEESEQE